MTTVTGYTDETRKRSALLFEQWRSEGIAATVSPAEGITLANGYGVDISSRVRYASSVPLGLVSKYVAGREVPLEEETSVWCPECALEVPLTVVRDAYAEGEFHECECGWFSA